MLWECNAIAKQIGKGQSFRLDKFEYDILPMAPNWRNEANTKSELFKNYLGALNIEAVENQNDGSWILTRK